MPSIFSRLHAYQARPGRSRLEDFLTEAVADLFNRLPAQDRLAMLAVLLKLPSMAIETTMKTIAAAGRVEARTQVTIATGHRPDVVFYADDEPVIVLEAKIGAAYQLHVKDGSLDAAGTPSRIETDQLATYVEWIEGRGISGWPGAVVLLTAWTAPPADFVTVGAGPMRTVLTWSDLGRWLENHAKTHPGETHCDLAGDLQSFLEEKKLMKRHFNERDLSALSIFSGSDVALVHTFQTVMKKLNENYPKLRRPRTRDCGIDSEVGVFWGWRFLDKWLPGSKGLYVGVGICTDPGPLFDLDRDKLPADEPFFMVFVDDEDLVRRGADLVTSVPEGWTVLNYHSALISCRPLRSFPASPDARVERLTEWSLETFGRLVAVLKDGATPPALQTPP